MRLLLDVDGVLADFMTPVLDSIFRHSGLTPTPESCKGWLRLNKLGLTDTQRWKVEADLSSEEFFRNLPVLPGAKQGVERIRDTGASIAYVTSPWLGSSTWCYERRRWLEAHGFLQSEYKDSLVITNDKWLVKGDMFVDDRVQNVLDWRLENPYRPGLIWDTEYNRVDPTRLPRVKSWEQLFKKVQQCQTSLM